jgi:aryl-alcohol dehydrogenase-like predicted oxidoreductase
MAISGWVNAYSMPPSAEEVMRAFDDLVRAGKVLYIGISDAPAWVVAKSNILAELRGWTRYVALQIEYSLLGRTVERELVPMARDQQMTVLAWSPLRNGLLTGKYLPENVKKSEAEGARMHTEMMKGFGIENGSTHATVREIVAVSQELGISAAQVALAWLRYRPVPVIPIIGARKPSQIEDNIRSVCVTLSPAQLQRLEKATAVSMGFPHDLMALDPVRAILYGGMRDRIKS